MTDNEIIKALEFCVMPLRERKCESCAYYKQRDCVEKSAIDAVALIQRQQKKIDELTDRTAIRAIDRIHYNIAEMNLIKAGFDMVELQKRFRAEFEEQMELGIEDCINWADRLDCIVKEMRDEVKGVQNE